MFGPRSAKPNPEPEPEPDELTQQLSAMERVAAHRALGLLEMGFTLQQVLVLVAKPDIVHQAKDLIDAGCPVEIAFDILT